MVRILSRRFYAGGWGGQARRVPMDRQLSRCLRESDFGRDDLWARAKPARANLHLKTREVCYTRGTELPGKSDAISDHGRGRPDGARAHPHRARNARMRGCGRGGAGRFAGICKDAGEVAGIGHIGVPIVADALPLFTHIEGVLDFATPAASVETAALSAQARIVHVIGTTGFAAADEAKIEAAAQHATIVKSGNMSLGVNLLAALVEQAARALGPDFDIEILEMHHKHKVDAPSGTALLLGKAAAAGREIALAEHSVRSRDGHTGERPHGAIGFAALRGGSVVGEHTVMFAARASGWNSPTAPRTGGFSRAARLPPRCGRKTAGRAFSPCATCSESAVNAGDGVL